MRVPTNCSYYLEIKEEKLIEYTEGLVRELKRTSLIAAFGKQLRGYMPKYNELKHFNPSRIATAFAADVAMANLQALAANGGKSLKKSTMGSTMGASIGLTQGSLH